MTTIGQDPNLPPDAHVAPAPPPPAILRWFECDHLRPGLVRDTAGLHRALAHQLVDTLPPGPELSTALRKLLEGKDAAVRAALERETPPPTV